MEVKFLGTAAAEGLPAPFCSCDICRQARKNGGKDLRLRSSILIDGVLKVDQPPDTVAQTHKVGVCLDSVRTLLLTHTHEDHLYSDDILLLVPPFSRTYDPPLLIRGPGGIAECLMRSAIHSWSVDALDVAPVEPFRQVDLPGGYKAVPLPAHHVPERVCLNYVIEAPGGERILYATDTGFWEDRTFDFLKEAGIRVDVAVVESTNGSAEDDSIHLSAAGTRRMYRRLVEQGTIAPAAPCFATHFSHGGGMLHEDLEESLGAEGIHPAYDGLTMEI